MTRQDELRHDPKLARAVGTLEGSVEVLAGADVQLDDLIDLVTRAWLEEGRPATLSIHEFKDATDTLAMIYREEAEL